MPKKKVLSMRIERRSEENRRNGGLVTMPFILGLEASEKMATAGLKMNMVNYLKRELHLSITKSATTLTIFTGTASLTPLLGAFLSDSFAGKFWTISISSITFLLGLTFITISATVPKLRPPPCHGNQNCEPPNSKHMVFLYTSLVLIALGWGGVRSSLSAFGADQLTDSDDHKSNRKTGKGAFFSWFFFVSATSMLLAATVLVYIEDNVGWNWGFGIPVVLLSVMTGVFVLGKRRYLCFDPRGSPFLRLLQVCVAAFRKRKLAMVSDSSLLFRNDRLDSSDSIDEKLYHTKQFKFLDKAAMATDKDDSQKPNPWRLSTVHRVEELKSILRMVPIWVAGIVCFTAGAQQDTFFVEQANSTNRHLTNSFTIPSGSMSVFTMLSMLTTIALFSRAPSLSHLRRIGVGLGVSAMGTLVAGFVEVKRKRQAIDQQPVMSVFWLVPQYALHGVSEAFISTGNLHFAYDQAPESMRSTATALFWLTMAAGNYGSSLLVGMVHRWSSWLPDDLNEGRLEWFYWIITSLQVVNFGYYLVCVHHYTLKPVQGDQTNSSIHTQGADGFHVPCLSCLVCEE